MKRIYYIVIIFILSGTYLSAQSKLNEVLSLVEANNTTLKSAYQAMKVQQIDSKTGIYPSNPSVEYEYLFGNKASNYKKESELTVAQELDFPTSYFQRNKIANMRSNQVAIQYNIARQQILFDTQQICIELVYYNKMEAMLKNRLKNTAELKDSFLKKLEIGSANILETNKIALEKLNTETEYRLNEVEIKGRLQKLIELNGGNLIQFTDTCYSEITIPYQFESILSNSLEKNQDIKNLEQEKQIASKSIDLAKSMWLPKFTVGYKMNISNPEKFHGFVAGVSIPLWENKNTVKKAKAEAILADMQIDNIRLSASNDLIEQYERMLILKKANSAYKELLSTQNNIYLLNKALDLGQISLLEYLTEINFLYQSSENHLQTERDYYLATSELLKNNL